MEILELYTFACSHVLLGASAISVARTDLQIGVVMFFRALAILVAETSSEPCKNFYLCVAV